MKFQPSKHSGYGWVSAYPISTLTVSRTGDRLGLSNQPASAAHKANLSLLSNFLGKLPFELRINSGYRSPAVNTAVGGSDTSQHPNGLAVDASPQGVSNKEVATWLFENRTRFPELDQVIWYTDTSHVHIGICPGGGTNCPRRSGPRGEFLRANKEGGTYLPWAPTVVETAKMAARYGSHRPARTVGILWSAALGTTVLTLGMLLLIQSTVRRKRLER